MTNLPRILAGILALALAGFALFYIFNPAGASAANGMAPETNFGITNMRANGASMLMMSILCAIAAARQKWEFIVPAALYFLLVALIRVLGLALDGFDANTIRGLVMAVVFFALAEVSLQLMRRKSARSQQGWGQSRSHPYPTPQREIRWTIPLPFWPSG